MSDPAVFMLPSHTDIQQSLRATRLLEQLLHRTWEKQLPPLDWRVTSTGTLVGDAPPWCAPDTARRVFDAWVAEIDLAPRPEHADLDGVRLAADGKIERVHVVVYAALAVKP